MSEPSTIIKIDPALPCARIVAGEPCGKPAKVGHAMRAPDLSNCMETPPPGPAWLVLPICEDCTGQMVEMAQG